MAYLSRTVGTGRATTFVPLVGLIVIALIAGGCGATSALDAGNPGGDVTEPVVEDPSAPVLALFEEPVPDDPDPAERSGAAASFIDCDHEIWDGGWSMDFGPPQGAPDAAGALVAFVGEGLFALPRSGFVHAGSDQARKLFTYSVGSRARVAVIVADSAEVPLDVEDGWVVETFASCDPAEFDPAVDGELGFEIWRDAEGRRVPIGTVRSSPGPEHCGWESATFLNVEGVGYVRDPDGVLQGITELAEFDGDAELPPDAIETGYELDSRSIWLAADRSIAYVVESGRVEAWPSPSEPFGCA